jgi:SAM-dependent methyltransferase
MNETFFNAILNNSRLLSILYDNLSVDTKADKLYGYIKIYLEKYAHFNNISAGAAIDIYKKFINNYYKDCKQFIICGKYPLEKGINHFSIDRKSYDIVLLLSVLFTPHRFKIMQLLNRNTYGKNALFIGLGPGLELALTKDKYSEIHTYDLSVNDFLFAEFPGIKINTELYTGQNPQHFDSVYLIELLEHLEEPYKLLETCYSALKTGGKVFLTTATNIPQFDHLYNFPKDHSGFELKIQQLGFTVLSNEIIEHNYIAIKTGSANHFYTLQKM